MGLKFRKLRSRLSSSWSVVRSKLTSTSQPPASSEQKRTQGMQERGGSVPDSASKKQALQERDALEPESTGEKEDLQWNESRRTYSEPVGMVCRTSVESHGGSGGCSLGLASHECEPELDEEYDDVFVEERSESWKESLSWEVEKGVALEDVGANPDLVRFSTGALEDWVIPANEVVLGAVISREDGETAYRGYWHGSVYVRTRNTQGEEDFVWFLDEVATLSCIRHENIQLFMGVCLDMVDGTLGVIMSELKGQTLHTRLHKYGHNFTTPSKLKILTQISEGMEYLHAKNIPHGSLSTRCVYIQSRVCISISPHTGTSRCLKPAHLTSTPPECMRHVYKEGGRMVLHTRPTYPEDIFAFGTMVYELVNLQKPFQSIPAEAVIWRVGRGECQSLALVPKGLLRTLISRCWAEQPSSRPSFKDLLITLEQNVVFSSTSRLKPSLSLPSIPSELSNTM